MGGDIELPFTLHWQWILSRFGRRKAEAMRSYYGYVIEGISDMKNPGDEASGGWILGRDSWVKRIIKKWVDNPSVELRGIKPLKSMTPIGKMEKVVCREFNVKESELSNVSYNNLARIVMIYLAVNYGGFSIKEALERYGGSNYYAIAKAISRIRKRVNSDRGLRERVNHILSVAKR